MTKLAEFNDYDKEYGQPELIKLNIDPKDFDISKNSYFNGDEDHTAREYEIIFREVAQWCNSNGYLIDDWNERYTTRTPANAELIRYNALTPEEKAKKDKDMHNMLIQQQIDELQRQLNENDYKQLKYIRGEYTDEEWEEIKAWFQETAKKISELREQIIE